MRKNADLLIAAALAGVSALVVVLVPNVPVRTLFALPLLFLLPGYALTAALFPRPGLDLQRRLLLQLGLSLSVGILSALVLDLTVGLRRSSWPVLLALVTWAAAAVAARRRPAVSAGASRAPVRLPGIAGVGVGVLALAVMAGAIVFARTPLSASHVKGYTALSILRVHSSSGKPAVRLDVSSSELQSTSYRLDLYIGSRLADVRQLTLQPGDGWRETVNVGVKAVSGGSWVRARLYRVDHPYGVYREVRVRWPAQAGA